MVLPSKISEQIAFIPRPRNTTHEKHSSQPLQTNNRQFKRTFRFPIGFNGIFNVTNSNNRFHSQKTITDGDDFMRIFIPPVAYESENLNNQIKRIIIDEEQFSESDFPFQIKPKFSLLGSFIEITPQGPIISFVFDDSIRNLLGFHETLFNKKYNLSPKPVDILSFDSFFLECDIAKGMI